MLSTSHQISFEWSYQTGWYNRGILQVWERKEVQYIQDLDEWTWLKETIYGRDSSVKMGLIRGMGGRPVNLLKPTGYVMHQQFNIQQPYALPTLYLCVLYLFENKQWLVSQHKLTGFYNRDEKCLQRGTDWVFK